MTRILVLIFLAATTLIGCAPIERQARFIESEYTPYLGRGTSSIVGQAFLRTRGGDVKTAAGLPVVLTPVTSYSAEWFTQEVLMHRRLSEPDYRTEKYISAAIADAEGRFKFNFLQAGRYYLTCDIYWAISEDEWSGDTAYAVVELEPDDTVEVVVTRPPD